MRRIHSIIACLLQVTLAISILSLALKVAHSPQSQGQLVADDNTLALWHFNEGEGQIVHDESSHHNDGTLGPTSDAEDRDPSWVSGFTGASGDYALSFDDWYDSWPMRGHDPAHTGYSMSKAPNTNTTLWSYTTGGLVFSSPAIVGGKVYIGSTDSHIYCLNTSTGEHIWSSRLNGWVDSSPAVSGDMVYVGTGGGTLYCLNASTGSHIWSFGTGDYMVSSPNVVDGRVYVGSKDRSVYCLNASTGEYIWSYATGGEVASSPAVVDGKVYVGSVDSNVYCFDAVTGDLVWSYTCAGSVWSSPAVVDNQLYVGSSRSPTQPVLGQIYCLDASSGAYIWSFETEGENVYSSPAVAYDRVYVGSSDFWIYCLTASNGELIWKYLTDGMVISSPAVADGKVYIGSEDNKLYCLDAFFGRFVWSYLTDGWVDSSPAVAHGKVLVGSRDCKVYAFGPVVHDVAVIGMVYVPPFKTVVGQGYITYIMVAVENQGDFTETFNITAYYNQNAITIEQWPDGVNSQAFWRMGDVNRDGYIDEWDFYTYARAHGTIPGSPHWNPDADLNGDGRIDVKDVPSKHYGKNIWTSLEIPKLTGNHKVVTILPRNFLTITFRWNTTGIAKGNYTLSAYVTPVQGEIDVADNNCTDGWVIVAMVGDITGEYGWPDGKCEMRDIAMVAKAYGAELVKTGNYGEYLHITQCGKCPHSPNCDITGPVIGVPDGKIEMRDVSIVAINFGKIDP